MGKRRYVIRHGRRIAVETLNPGIPAKRKKVEPFVMVPLWWIAAVAQAARSPRTLVLIELLHASWKSKSPTFPLPNGRLQRLGVSREIKRATLRDLERAGFIAVARMPRKTPIVTLVVL